MSYQKIIRWDEETLKVEWIEMQDPTVIIYLIDHFYL